MHSYKIFNMCVTECVCDGMCVCNVVCVCVMLCVGERELCFSVGGGGEGFCCCCFFVMRWSLATISCVCMF